MWIVLSQKHDICAQWLAAGLRARSASLVEWVHDEDLRDAASWRCEIGEAGNGVVIELADGRRLDSSSTGAVVNRLLVVPPRSAARAPPSDREYVEQEFLAFYVGWLNSFSGVVLNRACPQGLSGAMRTATDWAFRAARAGLEIDLRRERLSDSPETHLGAAQRDPERCYVELFVADTYVVTERPYPRAPSSVCEGCVALARDSGTPLMGVEFGIDAQGRWLFSTANPLSDLRPGGKVLLDALATVLSEGPGS